MPQLIKRLFAKIKNLISSISGKIIRQIDKRPLASFFTLLGTVILLIVAGNVIRNPAPREEERIRSVKEVDVYSIGKAPVVRVQAKIEKSGVIKITALSGGIVQKIYKKEGDTVSRGTWLLWLSSNYQGGTAPSLTRQIAEKNFNFIKNTYDAQKEIVTKNREVAEKMESQAADLREIGSKSVDDTKSLISLNENVLSMLDEQLRQLESIDVNGSSSAAILQVKQGKAAVVAGLNQAKAALRSTEYQTNSDNEPAALARLQKETTLKQLEVQEKSLDLNKDISLLNLRLAQIQESLMYPVSPLEGTVERIYVKVGQNVAPGTLLATVTGNATTASAVAAVSRRIAQNASRLEASSLRINGQTVQAFPSYISTEPTEGTLHSILFTVPDGEANKVANDQIVTVDIPVGVAQSNGVMPYVPLDSLYQTGTDSYLYVIATKDGKSYAQSRKVLLGEVMGEYVEVKSGIGTGDQVIIDRNVIEGDELKSSYGQ